MMSADRSSLCAPPGEHAWTKNMQGGRGAWPGLPKQQWAGRAPSPGSHVCSKSRWARPSRPRG
eukprot:4436483-Alexandrium_andersonii.AAC.1